MSFSNLKVTIDHSKQTARFSGAGTFNAKDKIKSLGNAKWLSLEKQWQISPLTLSIEELQLHFPEIVIEQLNSDAAPTTTSTTVEISDCVSSSDILPAGISVSTLISRARSVIQSAFPGTIYIYGVISSIKQRGDQAFIELIEQDRPTEKVHCVIWDNLDNQLKSIKDAGFELEADLQVMFEAKVGFNSRSASLSLTIVKIVAEYTIAKLAAERDKTNARLKEEGIFAKNKEQRLPFLPKRLGILTSSGGTVINDFRAALDVAQFGFELFWLPITVQGSEAKSSIINGIKQLEKLDYLDAILIFRGGGSKTELATFNDYEVAKAVCLCKKPIVSAIGHQEDQSSVQDVSSLSLGVPKDIGRFFSDIVINYRDKVTQGIQSIKTLGLRQVSVAQKELSIHCQSLHKVSDNFLKRSEVDLAKMLEQLSNLGKTALAFNKNQIERAFELIEHRVASCIERSRERIKSASNLQSLALNLTGIAQLKITKHQELLQQISPEVQMKRGFALVRRSDESYVISSSAIKKGDGAEIVFFDGARKATFGEEIETKKEKI